MRSGLSDRYKFYKKTGKLPYKSGRIDEELMYRERMKDVARENYLQWGYNSPEDAWQDLLNNPTYDYRGYYSDPDFLNSNANSNTHWPDTYKTPQHETFSNESKYHGKVSNKNPYGLRGGQWVGDKFIPAAWLNPIQIPHYAMGLDGEEVTDAIQRRQLPLEYQGATRRTTANINQERLALVMALNQAQIGPNQNVSKLLQDYYRLKDETARWAALKKAVEEGTDEMMKGLISSVASPEALVVGGAIGGVIKGVKTAVKAAKNLKLARAIDHEVKSANLVIPNVQELSLYLKPSPKQTRIIKEDTYPLSVATKRADNVVETPRGLLSDEPLIAKGGNIKRINRRSDFDFEVVPGGNVSGIQYSLLDRLLGKPKRDLKLFEEYANNAKHPTAERIESAFNTRRQNYTGSWDTGEYIEPIPGTRESTKEFADNLLNKLSKLYPSATKEELLNIFRTKYGNTYDDVLSAKGFIFRGKRISGHGKGYDKLERAQYTQSSDPVANAASKTHEANHTAFLYTDERMDKQIMEVLDTPEGKKVYFNEGAGVKKPNFNSKNPDEFYLDVDETTTYLSEAANLLGKTTPWTAQELQWLSKNLTLLNRLHHYNTYRTIFDRVVDYKKFAKALGQGLMYSTLSIPILNK